MEALMDDHTRSQRAGRIKLRLTLGVLNPSHVRLAAYLGDPDANIALRDLARSRREELFPEAPRAFIPWLEGLKACGQSITLRASLAYARTGLFQWKRIRGELKEKSVGHLCYVMGYQLVMLAEACLLTNDPDLPEQMATLLRESDSASNDLLRRDGLPKHAQLMELFVDTARVTTLAWQEPFEDIVRNLTLFWPEEKTRRNILRTHLVCWLLEEQGGLDPIARHPTMLPQHGVAD